MNLKNMSILLVLVLFVVGMLPFAFAEDTADTDNADEEDTNETVQQDVPFADRPNAKVKSISSKRFEQSRAEAIKRAQEKVAALKAKRAVSLKRMKGLRARHAELALQYKADHKRIGELRKMARDHAGTIREEHAKKFAAFKENKTKANAQAYLLKLAEKVLTQLENARTKIEGSDLAEEKKTELLAEIDESIKDVAAARDSIEELGEEATKKEIMEARDVIKEAWLKSKKGMRKGIGRVASSRMGGVIVKMEHLKTKLEKVVARLEERGVDTSSAKPKLDDFSAKLDEAKALHEEAKSLFEQRQANEAAKKIQEAHAKLKEAHKILKEFWQELKELRGTAKALKEVKEEETPEEAEVEAEEAEEAAEEESEAEETSEEAAEEAEEAAEEEPEAEETEENGAESEPVNVGG